MSYITFPYYISIIHFHMYYIVSLQTFALLMAVSYKSMHVVYYAKCWNVIHDLKRLCNMVEYLSLRNTSLKTSSCVLFNTLIVFWGILVWGGIRASEWRLSFWVFVLLNNIWSQQDHSVSCMTVLVSTLAIHQIRHRPEYCQLGIYRLTNSLYHPKGCCRREQQWLNE